MTVSKMKSKYHIAFEETAARLGMWLNERSKKNWDLFCFQLYGLIESECIRQKKNDEIEPSELAGRVFEKISEDFYYDGSDELPAQELVLQKKGRKPRKRITREYLLANYASGYDFCQSLKYILTRAEHLIIDLTRKKDVIEQVKTRVREAVNVLLKEEKIFEQISEKKQRKVYRVSFFKNNPDFQQNDVYVTPSEKLTPELEKWFRVNFVASARKRFQIEFFKAFLLLLFERLEENEKFKNTDLWRAASDLMGKYPQVNPELIEGSKEHTQTKEIDLDFFELTKIQPDEKTLTEANRKLKAFLRLKPKLVQLKSFLVHQCLIYPEALLVELGVPPAFIIKLRDLKVSTHKGSKKSSPWGCIQSQKIGIFLNIKRNLAFTQVTVIFKALEAFQKELELRKINQRMFLKAFLKVLIAEFKNLGFFS